VCEKKGNRREGRVPKKPKGKLIAQGGGGNFKPQAGGRGRIESALRLSGKNNDFKRGGRGGKGENQGKEWLSTGKNADHLSLVTRKKSLF